MLERESGSFLERIYDGAADSMFVSLLERDKHTEDDMNRPKSVLEERLSEKRWHCGRPVFFCAADCKGLVSVSYFAIALPVALFFAQRSHSLLEVLQDSHPVFVFEKAHPFIGDIAEKSRYPSRYRDRRGHKHLPGVDCE
jgi:hypothetical protein